MAKKLGHNPKDSDTDDQFLADCVKGEIQIETPNGVANSKNAQEDDDPFNSWYKPFGPQDFREREKPAGDVSGEKRKWDGNRSGE